MYISTSLVAVLAAASTAQALQFSDATARASNTKRGLISKLLGGFIGFKTQDTTVCPDVWSEISETLTAQFLADGQCTDAARAAIRSAFHDCFNGACDGSLILAGECSRIENTGLARLCGNLGNLATEKDVGVADLIQFAAAHAIKTCPGGPTVPVLVGRPDSSNASPAGLLPSGNTAASDLIKRFAARGFSAIDLAALIGAHTAARNRISVPDKANLTMDSTPGQWDSKYYSETINGRAPVTLPSDKSLANHPVTGILMRGFAASQGAWSAAFVPAMAKMSMLGVDKDGLVDCTSALPGGSRKRDVRRSNVFERLGW
ncbi:peroxidase 40 precursor [Paraphaeosphaeria sporulosa]|uniref:Peroxidase n=1 Tax=Paraphaeosphaeria sporulosa TaxID=1460663 RepID=A0A177C1Y0_9PLEO|nr:peroxidase 40 precursor [Paraphaeosphaeria sporulosa]OAG01794.1 peroxidase 40 precursor [Paraphaeosphaeria sporulosa]